MSLKYESCLCRDLENAPRDNITITLPIPLLNAIQGTKLDPSYLVRQCLYKMLEYGVLELPSIDVFNLKTQLVENV